jgi:hypothetical protein
MKHFKGFGRGFIKLQTKLDEDTLLDFAIHRRQKKTQSQKSTHVKTMHLQHGVMWQTDAIGLWKCDPGLPTHLLSQRQLQ